MTKMMIKNILKKGVIASVICSLMCGLTACQVAEKEKEDIILHESQEEMKYPIATVEYGIVEKNAEIACTYTPTQHEELSFFVDERLIETVNVKVGDIVVKGEVLAALDVGDLEDKMEELEYQIKSQKLKLEHAMELREFDLNSVDNAYEKTKKKIKDTEEWEEKREKIEENYHDMIVELEDAISLNTKRLQKYKEEFAGGQLIAGISGEITYLKEPLLDTYSEKEVNIATISDLDSCYFIADGMEYANKFQDGETYQVIYKLAGEESYIEVEPFSSDTWQEQMYFKPVNEDVIESGLNGTITLELEKKSQVLCVPNSALHKTSDGMFVYVWEDEFMTMRNVEIGLQGTAMTEIVAGLVQGEMVVLK